MNRFQRRSAASFLALSALYAATPAQAEEGDPTWHLGGAIRARYDDTRTQSVLKFESVLLNLNVDSRNWFGAAQYRFYEYYGHLGDTNFLTYGYVGYKIDPAQRLLAGVQQVPFGLLPYFGSTFYEGIANPLGLEDVHNLGVKYQYDSQDWNVQAGVYPRDAGNWTGHSKDSARYSINLVQADDPSGVNNHERNLLVGRVVYKLAKSEGGESEVGLSALGSQVHNLDDGRNGRRSAVAVHFKGYLGQWGTQLQAAKLDESPRNPAGNDDIVTIGGFDGSFNAATKGALYVAELNYRLDGPVWEADKIKLYANYSLFDKKRSDFKDSSRIILGSSFDFMKLYVAAELLLGKQDPYIGNNYNGALAAGNASNGWTRHVYVNIGYYF